MRNLITYGLFPVVFAAAMAVAVTGMNTEAHEGWLLAGIAVSTALITMIFERIHPKHRDWNVAKRDVRTDAVHLVVSMLVLPQLLEALLRAVLLVAAVRLSEFVGISLWPHHWHLAPQLILAMLVSQFGEYWIHRWMHTVPFLWRFHAVHHSPKRLYWLNAARFHPIDTALSFSFTLGSLLLLGAGPGVLLLVTVWITVHGLFQHSNIDVKLGPLNYVFSMAELHRWHHSLKLHEANSNYGNNIIFWDLVFGTMYYPREKEASERIGLSEMERFPEDYLGQIMAPVRWRDIEAENGIPDLRRVAEPDQV